MVEEPAVFGVTLDGVVRERLFMKGPIWPKPQIKDKWTKWSDGWTAPTKPAIANIAL